MFKKELITFVVIFVLLMGCVPQATPLPEPAVFSVLFNQREASPYQADWLILQKYKEIKNVTLDVRIGDDADYGTALSQTFDSGNIPDIVLKVWPDTVDNYAATGLLLPFSDHEDLMPNFMAYIKTHNLQSELDKLRAENGKYYILPGYQRKIQVQQWIFRRDAFEKNNLPVPDTYDELFDALVALKEIYPDSTPITALWGGAHLFAMMGAGYGITAGWNGTSNYDQATDRWQYSPATDNYREMLRFLNRCYAAGVLDPEIFTQSDAEFQSKLEDGRALVTVTWITSGFNTWNESLNMNGVVGGEWAPLPVPQSTVGIRALPAVDPYRKGLVVPSRVANEPYFEDLLKFLDWAVYSEEGMTLTTWGVEGVTFENTADGKVFLPEIITPKNPQGTLEIATAYGLDSIFNLNENEEFEDYKKPAEIVAFLARSLNAKETVELKPTLQLDTDTLEAIRIINDTINPYVDESMKAFITGQLSVDSDWDNYFSELKIRGYQTLEEIWNTAWVAQNK